MATRRRNLQQTSLTVGLNSCRPNLSRLFHFKQKTSTATAAASDSDSPLPSDSDSETRSSSITFRGLGRIGGESVAVEKDSDDPYLDFRQSMVQMIVENEIYSKEDLRELLRCFLRLNSPSQRRIIVRVFSEIWNSVFSHTSSVSPPISRF